MDEGAINNNWIELVYSPVRAGTDAGHFGEYQILREPLLQGNGRVLR